MNRKDNAMRNINEVLKGEALLLWEAAEVYDLDPEDMAPYIGVSIDRVYEWLGGGEIPTDEEKAKIRAGVEKIKRELPGPVFETLPSGGQVAACWGDPALDDEDPEILADRARCEAVKPLFAEFMAKVPENVRPIVVMSWPDFSELLVAAMKYGIKLPTK